MCVYNHLLTGKIFCLLPLNCLFLNLNFLWSFIFFIFTFGPFAHLLYFDFSYFFYILVFFFKKKRGNININSKGALITERIESRFFFKNSLKKILKMIQIHQEHIFLEFLLFCFFICCFFQKNSQKKIKKIK